jgi:hypothetical protein
MNRQQRRRTAAFEPGSKIKLADLSGTICAWADCKAHYERPKLPPGWVYLLVLRRPPGRILDLLDPAIEWNRDAVLCPEHHAALERLLKELLSRTPIEPQGGNRLRLNLHVYDLPRVALPDPYEKDEDR